MKLKYLLLTLMLLLFSSNLFGQNLTVEIFLENVNFWNINNLNLLSVKVINKSEKIVNTDNLKYFYLTFSKCSKWENCNVKGDRFNSYSAIPKKNLEIGESLEFEINLVDLYWNDATSSSADFDAPKNISIIPISNKYFYAGFVFIKENTEKEENPKRVSLNRRYQSNEIIFETTL